MLYLYQAQRYSCEWNWNVVIRYLAMSASLQARIQRIHVIVKQNNFSLNFGSRPWDSLHIYITGTSRHLYLCWVLLLSTSFLASWLVQRIGKHLREHAYQMHNLLVVHCPNQSCQLSHWGNIFAYHSFPKCSVKYPMIEWIINVLGVKGGIITVLEKIVVNMANRISYRVVFCCKNQ